MECNSLLRGAGYRPANYEHAAETGTRDPLLLEWVRDGRPSGLGEAQRITLVACWGMTQAHELADPYNPVSVETKHTNGGSTSVTHRPRARGGARYTDLAGRYRRVH